jgi:hypothetical protein
MIREKHGAVIGWKSRVFVRAQSEFPDCGIFIANHSAEFPLLIIKSRKFVRDDSVGSLPFKVQDSGCKM